MCIERNKKMTHKPSANESVKKEGTDISNHIKMGNRRVLLVDDESSIVKLISRLLRPLDIEVQGFTDPLQAIEAFREYPFPVLITDLSMPVMSGLELLTRVHEIDPAAKAIVLTGHGDHALATEALRRGASEFMEKPIQMAVLRATVETLLKRYHEKE